MVERRRPLWKQPYFWLALWMLALSFFVWRAVTTSGDAVNTSLKAVEGTRQIALNDRSLVLGLRRESHERRDQTCVVFERSWQEIVKNLTDTYQYLDNLSPKQRLEALNVAIFQQLPELERKVGTTKKPGTAKPPAYCKGKTGLDDSKFLPIPKRPRDLAPTP